MENETIPGWYGKIPALGDFSSRRLPSNFIKTWDTWLQQSIAASQTCLGKNWLNLYLNCSIWRFIIMPDICNNCIWTGILMPSVDKVGRYFPLTIANQFKKGTGILQAALNNQVWYANLEQVALNTLDGNMSPDDLDRRLLQYPFPTPEKKFSDPSVQELLLWWNNALPVKRASHEPIQLKTNKAFSALFSVIMEEAFIQISSSKSIWWKVSSESNPDPESLELHCYNGLPVGKDFIALLE